MATPTETVTAFLAQWEKPGGLDQSFRDYFTPETVWENIGVTKSTGVDEAIAVSRGFEQGGMKTIRVENLAIAESGNKVLTERIDHIIDGDGKTIVSARVMGTFEVAGGKILGWRDYFDMTAMIPNG